jgi:hypothetical protein
LDPISQEEVGFFAKKGGCIMLYRYTTLFIILIVTFFINPSLIQPVCAETLVQSTTDTRVALAMHVGQAEIQKLVPAPWQVVSTPGGPFKGSNFFIVFIDTFFVQDAQGKPDKDGVTRKVVFAVPVKHAQTGEMASIITGGFTANTQEVPGPYKNFVQATIRREQSYKGVNVEPAAGEDFWEVRDARGVVMELRIHYQQALSSRAKLEQKNYSGALPSFFRIYRVDQAMDIVKSIPAGINRVQNYQLHMAVPELKKLFDGTEQLVAVAVIPLYVRQIFLP